MNGLEITMFKDKSISVVIPTFNDGLLLKDTLVGIPSYVDTIIVVNDGSEEETSNIISECSKNDKRIYCISHSVNMGLGQSLIDGYLHARKIKSDITAVMAGDNQMAPNDLENVIKPIADDKFDYVKGNRLLRDDVSKRMPFYRYVGNSFLSLLTKIATGYWKLIDPQCGYTAISFKALKIIPIEEMIKGYGYNAHILNMLNLNNFRVLDVEVEPVYGDEKSKIKVVRYAFNVSFLLIRLTIKRLIRKYLIRDFHPLFLFYLFGFIQIFFISLPLLIRFVFVYQSTGFLPQTTLLLLFLSSSIGSLSCLIGMWLDMEDNKKLQG